MEERTCENCIHDKPYDSWLPNIRMCHALGIQSRKSSQIMKAYGECGPQSHLFVERVG